MSMFRDALEMLFDQQRERLSMVLGLDVVLLAFKDLETQGYDVVSLDRDCAEELKSIISKTYDRPIGSSRLDGFGWTPAHVKEHMRRFLHTKMMHISEVLRSITATVAEAEPDAAPEEGLAYNLENELDIN